MPSETHPEHPEKFYLTTPIYYVNARPHIGHAYSTIVADVLARRHRLLGHDTYFLTGTDEHGQKIERSAAAAGIPPQQFADQVSQTFRDLWQRMGITNDDFIRTTDPLHKQGVQKLFQTLYDQGHIYLSTYTGQYSIGEEMFVDGPPGTIGPDGRPTETVTEENFFFRLSAFQKPLLDLIESDTLKITPESSKNEVLSFLRGDPLQVIVQETPHNEGEILAFVNRAVKATGYSESYLHLENQGKLARAAAGRWYVPGALKDLSISRSSFTWGIPVPETVQQHAGATQPHIIYVWLDALANYMTAIGYGSQTEADKALFARYWPANLHLVGKEITRFHCVYWPAFLLALNPELAYIQETCARPSAASSPKVGAATQEPSASTGSNPIPEPTLQANQAWVAKWLPKAVTANGWLLFDNSKMSKSKGNVVRTETILEAFGEHVYAKQFPERTRKDRDLFAADVLRYYLLREIPFGQDGSFSFDSMITRYNADLANGYGNLVSRTLSMVEQYCGAFVPEGHVHLAAWEPEPTKSLNSQAMALADDFRGVYQSQLNGLIHLLDFGEFDLYLEEVLKVVARVDGFITSTTPWKLAKSMLPEDRSDLLTVLAVAARYVYLITAMFYPIIPYATAKVWHQLGLGDIEHAAANGDLKNLQWGGLKPGTKLGPLSPIFPRADKSLITLMEDLEAANNPPKEKAMPKPTPDTSQQSAAPTTHLAEPLKDQGDKQDPTHPAAPPRTSTLETENPGAHVAASAALTTERESTPPHTEAHPSGIFAATAGPSTPEASPHAPEIGIDDFTKIDLRVAKILVAERIPKADKLLRLEVDLGYEQRQILSGIAEHYTPEELIGRKIVIIANLAPRTMRKLVSHGMLLAASEGENGKPILATFGEDIAVGTRLR